eukprot:Gb_01335 [translate_table: standard]
MTMEGENMLHSEAPIMERLGPACPIMPTSSQQAEIHMGDGFKKGNNNNNSRLYDANPSVSEESIMQQLFDGEKSQLQPPAEEVGQDHVGTSSSFLRLAVDGSTECLEEEKISNKRRKTYNEEMDGGLWGKLNEELVEMIIARLPMWSIIRAQTVCRRWRSYISSPQFDSGYHRPQMPWLMVQHKDGNDGRWFFDPALNRWFKIEARVFHRTVCVGSSGGVLCLCKQDFGVAKLYLFNPITKNIIRLPPLDGRVKLATLTVNPMSMDYRVLVLLFGRRGLLLRMHQPNRNRWTILDVHTSTKLLKGVIDAIFFDDRLYCITYKNCTLLKMFDVKESAWKDIAVKRPRIFHVNFKKTPRLYLVESQGELLMVVRVTGPWWEGPEDGESSTEGPAEPLDICPLPRKRVWIFKFDSGRMRWTEVNGIQGRIFFLSRLGSRSVRAVGRGNQIYFTESEKPKASVLYDIADDSWEELPPCPVTSDESSCLVLPYPGEGLWIEPQMT